MKGNVMGRVYSVNGRDKKYTKFWRENLRERDHLEDPYVDGNIIL
jgi:hypothetical protein